MDTIFINNLKVKCVIGVWRWERHITQTVVFDLEMAADIQPAAASDQLQDTLNYKAVSKRVIAFAEQSKCQLVETLAEKTAQLILDEFDVSWCRVKVSKPGALRQAGAVGVVIERSIRTT